MPDHAVVSPEAWLEARKAFLQREKELTHLRDAINRERLALPWVRVEKEYVFDTEQGPRTLASLFDGRSLTAVNAFQRVYAIDTNSKIPDTLASLGKHVRSQLV